MTVTKTTLISTAFLGLSMASASALAENCAGGDAQRSYGYGHSGMSGYRPAVYVVPGAGRTKHFLRVGHHMSGYGKSIDKSGGKDIVDIAASAGDFDTLVVAVKAAGLVDTLKGEGPFTVFAPTDEAFAKIPKDQLNALLKDKAALTEVLTYHVVPGRVMAADVVKISSAKTVQGQAIRIDTRNGVKVNNARVVQTDIEASNGVIHVIDTVIMPK